MGLVKNRLMKKTMTIFCLMAAATAAGAQGAEASARRVLCWGDSVTEGMAMPRGKDYPSRLQALLGPGYEVLNSGDGGENTVTIPARQGAVPLATPRRSSSPPASWPCRSATRPTTAFTRRPAT